jgi:hypothetical protein
MPVWSDGHTCRVFSGASWRLSRNGIKACVLHLAYRTTANYSTAKFPTAELFYVISSKNYTESKFVLSEVTYILSNSFE